MIWQDVWLGKVQQLRAAGVGAADAESGRLDRWAFGDGDGGEGGGEEGYVDQSGAKGRVPARDNATAMYKPSVGWSDGVWEVAMHRLDSLRATMPPALRQLVVSGEGHTAGALPLPRTTACSGPTVVRLPPSGWNGVLRNVPAAKRVEGADPLHWAVGVSEVAEGEAGRVLVLVGLKHRGNLGTIVRSAVQANTFAAIWIVETSPPPDVCSATRAGFRHMLRRSTFDGSGAPAGRRQLRRRRSGVGRRKTTSTTTR